MCMFCSLVFSFFFFVVYEYEVFVRICEMVFVDVFNICVDYVDWLEEVWRENV